MAGDFRTSKGTPIDPLTEILIAPWDKDDDGILDQEKELPSDDDRSDHPRDR